MWNRLQLPATKLSRVHRGSREGSWTKLFGVIWSSVGSLGSLGSLGRCDLKFNSDCTFSKDHRKGLQKAFERLPFKYVLEAFSQSPPPAHWGSIGLLAGFKRVSGGFGGSAATKNFKMSSTI